MHFLRIVLLISALLWIYWPAATQTVNTNRPSDVPATQPVLSAEALRNRLQSVQFQKDLDELTALYSSIATDLNQVKGGVLPKDLLEKMNRAEKLSKRVGQDLAK